VSPARAGSRVLTHHLNVFQAFLQGSFLQAWLWNECLHVCMRACLFAQYALLDAVRRQTETFRGMDALTETRSDELRFGKLC